MARINFMKLIIASPSEETAKSICFDSDLNVITSNRKKGNDLGKSVITKSLYHCMGADCKFDDKFDVNSKVFILKFSYGSELYTIFRSRGQFKLFDERLELLWTETHRHLLAEKLHDQFGFAIWLTSRASGKTEIASPAYSYAPYFVDQNHYDGSHFNSFNNMGEYSSYKSDLIYEFAGAYDHSYLDLTAQKTDIEHRLTQIETDLKANRLMRERIQNELEQLGYSADMPSLKRDCDEFEDEYKRLATGLSKIRKKLYRLKSDKTETEMAYAGSQRIVRKLCLNAKSLRTGKCPLCEQDIFNTLMVRVNSSISHEDALLLSNDLGRDINELDRKIAAEEERYKSKLSELAVLKAKMNLAKRDNLTAVQIEGFVQLNKRLLDEYTKFITTLEESRNDLDKIKKQLNSYSSKKSEIDKRFVELTREHITELNLRSIDKAKIKNVNSKIEAGGSNAPLATLAWYLTLLDLKKEFNEQLVELPVVLDSPLNIEADDEKYYRQYSLIFSTFIYQGQMIVSGLNLADSEVVPRNANIIILNNEKYHLLNKKDYSDCKSVVFKCLEQN